MNAPRYTDGQLAEFRKLADPVSGKLDLRAARHRRTPGTFAVATAPLYPGDDYDPNGEQLILVDGRQIGGTYTTTDGWGCWGPAGWSWSHPTHQAAVDVQVRAYAIDPDSQDRVLDTALANEAARREEERREREEVARRRAEERRRRRLGDDQPGPTVWRLPAYHVLYARLEETARVSRWLRKLGIPDASAVHEIRVEQRATRRAVVYEAPGRGLVGKTDNSETTVITCTAEPPTIAAQDRPDLHALLEEHWPTEFPQITPGVLACPVCTRSWRDLAEGESLSDGLAVWPCGVVQAAIEGQPAPVVGADTLFAP
jgi:hypothetical protein